MNFINKLKIVAGLKLDKTNETNENHHCQILKDDSIDVIFAKKLIQNNGNFFYCDEKKVYKNGAIFNPKSHFPEILVSINVFQFGSQYDT